MPTRSLSRHEAPLARWRNGATLLAPPAPSCPDLSLPLSPNFPLYEFVVSQQGARFGLENLPPLFAIENLKLLALNLLEPIRAAFVPRRASELVISSGYRSAGLNRLLGGAPLSQHTKGQAADFYLHSAKRDREGELSLGEVFDWVRSRSTGLAYDQLIYEFPERGGWLHISYASPARRQALIARRVDGRVVYEQA